MGLGVRLLGIGLLVVLASALALHPACDEIELRARPPLTIAVDLVESTVKSQGDRNTDAVEGSR